MPRTPDAGGIPLPPSWPPFNRDCWHDRARCLIDSLSRHGHEGEDYASVPPALNLTKGALEKAAAGREESSIGLAKKAATGGGKNGGGDADDAPRSEEKGEEEEDPNRLEVRPTKVLKTYDQRRRYIAKAMDMHRHTIGGGRSGRRGRAECIAFLRYCLEVLDEQYADALEVQEAADGAVVGHDTGNNEEQEEEESSSEGEEESEEEEGGEDEDEEEEEEEAEESEAEVLSEEEQAPKRVSNTIFVCL